MCETSVLLAWLSICGQVSEVSVHFARHVDPSWSKSDTHKLGSKPHRAEPAVCRAQMPTFMP